MAQDALFWIASMTKPFTAVALMMLVDEGKVSLDDPVSTYVPRMTACGWSRRRTRRRWC
jgi:CubicO group peptidase (beta-lactamase class C family)